MARAEAARPQVRHHAGRGCGDRRPVRRHLQIHQTSQQKLCAQDSPATDVNRAQVRTLLSWPSHGSAIYTQSTPFLSNKTHTHLVTGKQGDIHQGQLHIGAGGGPAVHLRVQLSGEGHYTAFIRCRHRLGLGPCRQGVSQLASTLETVQHQATHIPLLLARARLGPHPALRYAIYHAEEKGSGEVGIEVGMERA